LRAGLGEAAEVDDADQISQLSQFHFGDPGLRLSGAAPRRRAARTAA
jgi:hypothetical protein